jgi:hypothetical protein
LRKRLAMLAATLIAASATSTAQASRQQQSNPAPARQLSAVDARIAARFGPHAATAICVSRAEDPSRRPDRVSPTGDHGLFQIHSFDGRGRWVGHGRWRRYFTVAQLHTVAGNIRAALILSNHGSQWRAWTGTYGRGLCRGLG